MKHRLLLFISLLSIFSLIINCDVFYPSEIDQPEIEYNVIEDAYFHDSTELLLSYVSNWDSSVNEISQD